MMKRHFIVNIDCHTAETFTKERAQLHKRTDSEMRKVGEGGGLSPIENQSAAAALTPSVQL